MKNHIEDRRITEILLNNSKVIVFITDKDGNIVYVNKRFTEITGYSEEEALGKNPRFLSAGVLTEDFYISMWKTIKSGKNWEGIFINKKKNGEIYYESATISPVINSKGEIEYYVAIKHEITEREGLIDNTTRHIANHIPLGVFVLDHEKRIIFANKTVEKIFKIKRGNILNQKADQLLKIKKEDEEIDLWKKIEKSAQPVKLKQIVLTINNNPKLINLLATKIEKNSKQIGSVLTIEDISETKDKERAAKKAEDIEQISVFLMGFAHDFNNLLAITQMQLQNAEFYLEKDKEKAREKLRIISEKLNEISKLTSDFFEAVTSAPVYRKVNLVELINTVITDMANSFPGVKFSLKVNGNFELMIDREKIKYTLREIVKNAIEAQDFKGEVKITVAEASQEETLSLPLLNGRYVKISIKDKGRGIKQELLPLLFTPYFTTKQRTREKQTGLSLALCNFNVKKHGGYIRVKTKLGKGSEFTIYLPIKDKNL